MPAKKSAQRADNSHGKAFENMTNSAFGPLHLKLPMTWERIIDSAAAGNFIAAREGDFRLRINSGVRGQPFEFLIECKASVLDDTFAKCFKRLIGEKQLPKMRLACRAGAIGLYLFHSVNTHEIEIWDFRQVAKAYYEKRTKFEDVPKYLVSEMNYSYFANQLCSKPAQFIRDVLGG
jgi:hypothetical protein